METKKQKKRVFITIIILLVIFLPLSVFSFVLHLMDKENPRHKEIENPSHEFQYNGNLYFYSQDGSLIGTYQCTNPNGICDYATNFVDDTLYSVDYYKAEETKIPLIRGKYVFLVDSESENRAKPFLYDVVERRIITTYSSVKNYGIGIENDLYIVGNEALKYGVLSLEDTPYVPIKFEYDYLGIANFVDEDTNLVLSDLFVGYKDKFWFLLDRNGAVLTKAISREIVSYNGKNIITKEGDNYYLVDYQDNLLLEDAYQKLSFTGKYLNVIDFQNQYYIYDITTNQTLTTPQSILSTDSITSQINEDGKLEIILNDEVIETVNIS